MQRREPGTPFAPLPLHPRASFARTLTAACMLSLGLTACGDMSLFGWGEDGAPAPTADGAATPTAEAAADSPEKLAGGTPAATATRPSSGTTTTTASRPSTGSTTSGSTTSGSGSRSTTSGSSSGSTTSGGSTPTPSTGTTPTAGGTGTTAPTAPKEAWIDTAVRDMRNADGSYARNDDKLLQRTMVSLSSQYTQAYLAMGHYPTKAAFTSENPDYRKELSYISMDDPLRYLETWPRLTVWDQVYLSESHGPNHAPGYRGNSRVKTWGYEAWVKSKSTGKWTRLYKTDTKNGEGVRPTFKGSATRESYGWDFRKEPDGSTSVRTVPAMGFDSSGSYWVPHGYLPAPTIDAYDVAGVVVVCWSQLVLHDPNGPDDRRHARFLLGLGVDWLPPAGVSVRFYPSAGSARHKYVTTEPQIHVMHTLTEAQLRANPPPR